MTVIKTVQTNNPDNMSDEESARWAALLGAAAADHMIHRQVLDALTTIYQEARANRFVDDRFVLEQLTAVAEEMNIDEFPEEDDDADASDSAAD